MLRFAQDQPRLFSSTWREEQRKRWLHGCHVVIPLADTGSQSSPIWLQVVCIRDATGLRPEADYWLHRLSAVWHARTLEIREKGWRR